MNHQNIRNWQYQQIENNIKSYEALLSLLDRDALTTYRDGGTGWTALEIICHLRDFEQVFIERAQVAVEQEEGALPFPNPDALAAEGRYMEQSLDEVLAEWKRRRAALLEYYRARPDADWERVAIHPTRGRLTLLDLLCMTPMHDALHLEQLTRTLREKRTG
jgi:uncharacterized damage-inducible protein DinB